MSEEREKSRFEEMISQDRDEHSKIKKEWRGTFGQYLDILAKDPDIAKLSHKRVFDTIMAKGAKRVLDSDDSRIKRLFRSDDHLWRYGFFDEDFFGIEETCFKIVRFFHAASLRGEESRQVLYLMGPVGSGKSSLVEKIREGLMDNAPFYALENCPMYEEPLHLTPRHFREKLSADLNVKIEGDLCPFCRFRLKDEFDNKYEDFPVRLLEFSKRSRVGIGIVPPVDPNNQDTSVLIGSEDISKLDLYSEGDPRVLNLNGAFNVGNRGLVEFIEVFKNETEYLHTMITATQEKSVPAPGRHGMVYVDTVIVAHSNEAEWNKFKADHTNQAILDRIVVLKIPYNLRVDEEIRVYQKIFDRSDFKAHIAPHALEMAARFAILSRLAQSKKCDLMTKLKIYNGEEVTGKEKSKKIDLRELKEEEEARREGLEGISPRLVFKAIDDASVAHVQEGGCVNPINLRGMLIEKIKESDFPDDVKKRYLGFLQDILDKDYKEILEKEITKAFIYGFPEHAETLFMNYLDHVEAFVTKTKVKDADTKEDLQPDEQFLKSIEEQIGIVGSAAESFRQEVYSTLMAAMRRGEKLNYRSNESLKEAIEKHLMLTVQLITRVVIQAKKRDTEQEEKHNAMLKNMIENGYCEKCAGVALKYAANHLWKD